MTTGTDKIVSNIMSEAQSVADDFIQKAQVEVEAITTDGSKKADAEKNKILEDAKKQADMKYQQIISEAKMNARRAELGAKEEVIELAFTKATDDLKNIASSNDNQYIQALNEMIKEAAIEIGGGDLIVHLKEEDIAKAVNLNSIAEEVSTESNVETTFEIGEPIETIGGAILKTKNGDIEVNNTIESRLLRFKKSLRSEVAKILFN